ncbi:hypothetical protein [Nocardia rhizosphaerihabitans]|uniref:Sporulation protein n=1 Tax=Nocardia rhizosphaerihabitans TaxID=1691570 RepID=A0ABQ2KTF7_9NOCA|nr:hypothetical protein [Nocardia rhizosphaerihabitans]GGN92763.1 hypothetical protein GCM10011610_54070 [Nocardia rhizosphaerihabitans]
MTIRDRLEEAVAAPPTVFGEPMETADGTTIITVARGSAFGRSARPVGVFVVHEGRAHWTPAVDSNRIAQLGEWIGLLTGVIATLAILRRPPWPDLRRR